MIKFLSLKPRIALVIFVLLDLICVGMGMGVPFFCILLGFPVGWYIVRYITSTGAQLEQVFRKVFMYSLITTAFTLLAMLLLWTPFAAAIFDPTRDLAQTGIPMILYEPRASFIGWVILMILISPFLQLLTTLFGAYLALLSWMEKRKASIEI
jgi:hypothetical protein